MTCRFVNTFSGQKYKFSPRGYAAAIKEAKTRKKFESVFLQCEKGNILIATCKDGACRVPSSISPHAEVHGGAEIAGLRGVKKKKRTAKRRKR